MTLAGRRLVVSFPDTVLEEKDSLREKTAKLGLIARACAIYGVDTVEVFPGGGRGDWGTIREVLEYLETPQYLRKRIFPINETLRFAGVLPPLRIPSHKQRVRPAEVRPGEFREGVVEADGRVEVGLEGRATVEGRGRPGERVTVRLTSGVPLRGEIVPREEAGEYWGYRVVRRQLAEVLADRSPGLTIATSKFGEELGRALPALQERLAAARGVRLVFGSPSRGLFDLVGRDLATKADVVVNLFPDQKVETVRSEEAVFAGLGLLTVLSVRESLSANGQTGPRKGSA